MNARTKSKPSTGKPVRWQRMERIIKTTGRLIGEIDRGKHPSNFVTVIRGALLAARDNAGWELERMERRQP